FNREKSHDERFRKINRDKLREDLRTLHYNAVYLPSIDVFSALGIGLVIWYGGGRFVQEEIQLGVLVAFLQYIVKFFDPIRDLAEKFNIIQTTMASSERIFELLDTPEDLPNPPSPVPVKKIDGNVEFKNVSFAYKNGDYILNDISFAVQAGESLAIIGATGSGKTTIINTLCRFYDIQKGDILIDGVSIRTLDKYDLRRQIALIQQDVFLFSGNILDNIRLRNPELDLEDVVSVSRAIHLHDFIDSLPSKYKQDVLEKGSALSMGQRQLLSFARALAFNPRIMVLDEATSSVDTETEALIQDAMKKLMRGRTSIVIAHRLSTLKNADKVLILENGSIRESGSRKELWEKKGIYYNLVSSQAADGEKT
ncbi:MAG: ABC transporter ATP-binding protein, partial [Nitrospinales bacterium]